MDKIYVLFRHQQECDADCWNHWVIERPISYHKTREGAQNKITELLKPMVNQLETLIVGVTHNPKAADQLKTAEIVLENTKANNAFYQVGTSRTDVQERCIFGVKELTLEP